MGRWRGCVGVAALAVLACAVGAAAASSSPRAHSSLLLLRLDFARTPLALRLGRALRQPYVRRNEGAFAVDLRSGRTLYSLNGNRSFEPASNEKLAVTYTALVRLGAGYRFHTDVLGSGWRRGHVWHGDLYLQGHGDPTLHTSALVLLARHLRGEGISYVTGRVRGDESWFDTRRTAPGWDPSYYMTECAPLSALVVDRAQLGGTTTPDPAGAASAIFARVLRRHGIRVAYGSSWGTAPAHSRLLARIGSQPLGTILRFMDHDSDNFTAEMLLKTLGAVVRDRGTTAAGATVVRDTLELAGIPLRGVRIVDGSGLSELDRLTPRTLAAILGSAWRHRSLREPFWRALAVAGRSGTLAFRMTSGPGYGTVHAKTGTTDFASALSGYVRRRFAFVVIQNGFPVATDWAHVAQDSFATALAARG